MAEEKTKRKTTVSPASPGTSIARRQERNDLSRGIDSMFDEFRRSFDDLMRPFFPWTTDIEQAMTLPTRYAAVDLVDNGDSYMVTAELPGFTKDQVDVQINKDGLSIQAECKEDKEEKRKIPTQRKSLLLNAALRCVPRGGKSRQSRRLYERGRAGVKGSKERTQTRGKTKKSGTQINQPPPLLFSLSNKWRSV